MAWHRLRGTAAGMLKACILEASFWDRLGEAAVVTAEIQSCGCICWGAMQRALQQRPQACNDAITELAYMKIGRAVMGRDPTSVRRNASSLRAAVASPDREDQHELWA